MVIFLMSHLFQDLVQFVASLGCAGALRPASSAESELLPSGRFSPPRAGDLATYPTEGHLLTNTFSHDWAKVLQAK